MRNRIVCCRGFESIAPIWVVPLLFSLAVSLVLCVVIGTATVIPIDVLLSLSRDMLNLLGVIAAILIAVITTMYVISEQGRRGGFQSFFQGHNSLREMPREIRSSGDAFDPNGDGIPNRLLDILASFVERMDKIRPTWRGFDDDPDLENEMRAYINGIRSEVKCIAVNLARTGYSIDQVEQLDNRIVETGKGMLVGLLSMESGIVGRWFVERLLKLSLSLTCLLVLSLSVRALVGPFVESDFGRWSWLSLSMYMFIAAAAVTHVVAFICAAAMWRRRMRAIEEAWERE